MMDRLQNRFDFDSQEAMSRLRDRYEEARKQLMRSLPGERRRRERRAMVLGFAGGVAVGALIAYLVDPVLGRTRRARLADQAAARGRDVFEDAERFGRRVTSDVEGRVEAARYGAEGYTPPNDVTLASKVESEVLGRPEIPKGSVLVNVEHGRVVLRGTVDRPELRDELTRWVLGVEGVDEVENLVHLPGEVPANTEEVRRLAR